jgi:nicotinate-nucleotide pyrophosphorylase
VKTPYEYRQKISSLQTNNSHMRLRLHEITVELENLRKLRQAVSIYLDAMMVGEPTEKQLKVMKYLVMETETPNNEVFKRTNVK